MSLNTQDLQEMRQSYERAQLDEEHASLNPFAQFELWFDEANKAELLEPNAMIIATVDEHSMPDTRTALLKGFSEQGFVFYTNYGSQKAKQLAQNPNVALQFLWLPLERQVKIQGRAEKLSRSESLQYFLSRPRGSQLGAWVSEQSQIISNKSVLLSQFAKMKEKFAHGDIPLPDFWGGYRVVPEKFEFWQGGKDRLHDRLQYRRQGDDWTRERLAP